MTDSGTQVGFKENYVYVTTRDGETKVPVETLESISIFGRSQITTQCVQECLGRGIPISYYSRGGRYFGRLQSTGHVNVRRQRLQAQLLDKELGIAIAKKIVESKIHNQIVVMKRYGKSRNVEVEDSAKQMKIMSNHLESAHTIEQIMGYEGNAARIYFSEIGKLVEERFRFQKRTKRPPLDPFNSMLSLGYSLLMNELYGKIESKGLNPYFGLLHQDHEKHPTLASDLMEEWRAVIVDSLVLSLVNGHEIGIEHFSKERDRPGIFLTDDGMKIFLNKMEGKLRQEQHYLKYVEYNVSFRRGIELQVMSLVRAIEANDPDEYQPIRIR